MKRTFIKRSIVATTQGASRSSLIDYIDENYNTVNNYKQLEDALAILFGIDVDDDSDPDEGFYANLSNDQLVELKDYLEPTDVDLQSYSFTGDEVSLLIEAMENFADPSFTKNSRMSATARKILNKLTHRI